MRPVFLPPWLSGRRSRASPPLKIKKIACAVLFLFIASVSAQQSENPLTYQGGSLLAMAGHECVALAVDKRFASGSALVTLAKPPLMALSPSVLLASTGLQTDVQSLQRAVQRKLATKAESIGPKALASLLSHLLYSRRRAPYYVEPVVVGLQKDDSTPFICSFDMIGAKSTAKSFACSGAATKSLFGMAESMWRPDMTSTDLVNVCGTAFLRAIERDCLSGYGALVYLITKDGIEEFELATRND